MSKKVPVPPPNIPWGPNRGDMVNNGRNPPPTNVRPSPPPAPPPPVNQRQG